MKQRVSDVITEEIVSTWEKGDVISISAGTGVGKSYFVKNVLYEYAKKRGEKILFLIHRTNCVTQFREEIKRDNKKDIIDIQTYQSIEAECRTGEPYNFRDYSYIVSDEFHYFIKDSSFNRFAEIGLEEILKQNDKIRIFMSATGGNMIAYFKNFRKIKVKEYEIKSNFDFINELYFYRKKSTLETIIQDCIDKQEKVIIFMQSTEEANELYKQYKNYAIFNCSTSNPKNKKYLKDIDENKIKMMLKREKFEESLLITTTAMDAGVNILDSSVRNIICDLYNIDDIIQCIGRKRIVQDREKIDVYIKEQSMAELKKPLQKYKKINKKVEILLRFGIECYIQEYPRDIEVSGVFYDDIEEDGKLVKKVNHLVWGNSVLREGEYENYLNFGYKGCVAESLERPKLEIEPYFQFVDYEEVIQRNSITPYLEKVANKRLYKEEQANLIEVLNKNGLKKKNISNASTYLKRLKTNYTIDSFKDRRRKLSDGTENPNRDKVYWKVSYLG